MINNFSNIWNSSLKIIIIWFILKTFQNRLRRKALLFLEIAFKCNILNFVFSRRNKIMNNFSFLSILHIKHYQLLKEKIRRKLHLLKNEESPYYMVQQSNWKRYCAFRQRTAGIVWPQDNLFRLTNKRVTCSNRTSKKTRVFAFFFK